MLEYERHVMGGEDGRRTVERRLETFQVTGAASGGAYRVVGIVSMSSSSHDSFSCRHTGVLVGRGPLNNRALTIAVRVTEKPGGTATAEIVGLHLR